MNLRRLAGILCLLCSFSLMANGSETAAEHQASQYAAQEMRSAPIHGNLTDYSLSPAKLLQAQHLASLRLGLHFGGEAWGILQLVLLLAFGAIAWMRNTATRFSRNRWLQAYLFSLLFLVARVLLNLPLNLYGHRLALRYGLSIQRWPSWFADLAKGFVIEWFIGGLLILLLFRIVRLSPRRWWLIFWMASIPIALGGVYLAPLTLDHAFNQFEPLALHHPELVTKLEQMGVPANHQFLMKASAKVTTPNAYVTGLWNSKRVVVWDTSISKSNDVSPEVLWMVGHECGHYVLGHVLSGTLLSLAGLLPLLYLCYLFVQVTLRRFDKRWCIPSQQDWGALAVLLLAFSLLSAVTEPIENTTSRLIEHHADIYGQEAIHGLVSDPQIAVKDANDSDGLRDLDDPNPSPMEEFWTYNHPATGRRAAFGKAYDPWAPGMEPKYFKKQ